MSELIYTRCPVSDLSPPVFLPIICTYPLRILPVLIHPGPQSGFQTNARSLIALLVSVRGVIMVGRPSFLSSVASDDQNTQRLLCAPTPACGSPFSLFPSSRSKRILSGYAQPVTGMSQFRTGTSSCVTCPILFSDTEMMICSDGSRLCQLATRGGARISQDINMRSRVPNKAVISPLTAVLHMAIENSVFSPSCFHFSHLPPLSPLTFL